MNATLWVLAAATAALAQVPTPAGGPAIVWRGADGAVLSFGDEDEVTEYLRSAEILSSRDLATGITRPKKLLLEKDGHRAHAVFRYGDSRERELAAGGGRARFVHDSYRNEVAAWELARLLGMDNLPPTVERQIDGVPGSVQLWVEAARTEGERREAGLEPPDAVRFHRQRADQRVFDELIGNPDRNLGNTLIDGDWKLWLIDHTRAFGRQKSLLEPATVERCSRSLWQKLRALDPGAVEERLGPYLSPPRVRSLLARHRRLVEHLGKLIAERGEGRVIFRHGAPAYEIEGADP